MSVKRFLKNFAFEKGILLGKTVSATELEAFFARFRERYVAVELERIGGDGDGGYLLPNNLHSIAYCFSPGVDYTAQFETEISEKYGIKSFMADASVDDAPVQDENFSFIPKFLGARTEGQFVTLSDWVRDSVGDCQKARILQMDIEGGEYDVLTFESAETLAQFSTIVIEFHNVQNLFERHFFQMFSSIMEKLYLNFSICHVHPNNCLGVVCRKGIEIPRVLEATFVRNDLVDEFALDQAVSLPHPLDRTNVEHLPDIVLADIWWKRDGR